ncbi:MAG: DoxX family membrane protein [Gemmatimonadetes bacterium]|nr:DoxX family membrane protein [Gemmatimonadota bacterium]
MTPEPQSPRTLALALAVLRISLGLFLLLWSLEKFFIPQTTVGIWKGFYLIDIGPSVPYLIGALETVLALAITVGLWRRISYGLGFVLHFVSVAASWKQLIDPWGLVSGGRPNHLFLAGVPVLAGFFTLYLLRDGDLWTLDEARLKSARQAAGT